MHEIIHAKNFIVIEGTSHQQLTGSAIYNMNIYAQLVHHNQLSLFALTKFVLSKLLFIAAS